MAQILNYENGQIECRVDIIKKPIKICGTIIYMYSGHAVRFYGINTKTIMRKSNFTRNYDIRHEYYQGEYAINHSGKFYITTYLSNDGERAGIDKNKKINYNIKIKL